MLFLKNKPVGRVERVFKNASWGIISKFINTLILFLGRTVFIHQLGEQYLGVSSLFANILTVLSLAELGFAEAITFSLYKPLAENDSKKVAQIMNFFKKVYITIGIIIFVMGVCITPFVNLLVNNVPNIKESIYVIFLLYIINTSCSYFYSYKSTLLEASQEKYITSLAYTIICLIKTIINCAILILTKNFILYLIVEILGTVLYNILISYITQKKYSDYLISKETIEKSEKKDIIKNVKAMFFYKVSGVFLTSTDNIIINSFVGTILVGKYSNYTLITTQIHVFMLQIFNAFTASIGNLAATETKEKQYEVFLKVLFVTFVIYCISSSLILILITPFINFMWTDNYILPNITVLLVTIIFYIMGTMTTFNSFRISNGLFVQGQYRPVAMVILNIVLSLILVKPLGINGVLIATIVARLGTEAWFDPYLIYKKVFKRSFKEYLKYYSKYTITTIIIWIILIIISNYINVGSLFLEILIKAIITLCVSTLIIILIYNKTDEFKYFKSIFKTYTKKLLNRH